MRKIEDSITIPIIITIIVGIINIIVFLKGFLDIHFALLYTLLALIVARLLHIVFKLRSYDTRLSNLDKGLFVHDNFATIALDFAQNLTSEYIDNQNLDDKGLTKEIIKNLQEASNKVSKILPSSQSHYGPQYGLSSELLHELLDKYKNESLEMDEAYELRALLEEEKAKKEQEGDTTGVVLVGILLLAILAFIAYVLSQRR